MLRFVKSSGTTQLGTVDIAHDPLHSGPRTSDRIAAIGLPGVGRCRCKGAQRWLGVGCRRAAQWVDRTVSSLERVRGEVNVTQWDFTADLEQLVASVEVGAGPRSMSSMIQAAASLAQRSRSEDPAGLESWLNDNAAALIGQQLLIANVHAQQSAATDLPQAVHEWAAEDERRTPLEALAWLMEEHPGLLRAWLLSRAEDLIGEELARSQATTNSDR